MKKIRPIMCLVLSVMVAISSLPVTTFANSKLVGDQLVGNAPTENLEGNIGSDNNSSEEIIQIDKPVVTITNDKVDKLPVLNWEAVEGADKYEVARSDAKEGKFVKLVEGTELKYKDETAEPGKTYYYQVKAICSKKLEASATSDAVECIVPKVKLDAPAGVTATLDVKTGKPELKWNKVNSAEKYEIYVVEGKEVTKLATVAETAYTHDKAVQGTEYTYKVRAIATSHDNSEFSSEVTILCKCVKPVVKAENDKADKKPILTWNTVEGADKYEVARSDAKEGKFVKLVEGTELKYKDETAEPGKTYYYQVKAICSKNSEASATSDAVECVVYKVKLDIPAGFTVTLDVKTGKPELKWNKVNSAEKYEIYVVEGKEVTKVATVAETAYTHDNAVQGTEYTYKVRAIATGYDNSEFSSEATILCKCVKPVVKAENDKVDKKTILTWNSVEGADKYEIYRTTALDGTYEKIGYTKNSTYSDTRIEYGKTYYYQVEAICSKNSEANAISDAVECVIPKLKLNAPAGLTATLDVKTGKPQLKWNIVEGADKYEIYVVEGKETTKLATVAETAYTHDKAVHGTDYTYKVRAIATGHDNSEFSSEVTILCKCVKPVVKAENDKVNKKPILTWNTVEGADKYEIYRSKAKTGV